MQNASHKHRRSKYKEEIIKSAHSSRPRTDQRRSDRVSVHATRFASPFPQACISTRSVQTQPICEKNYRARYSRSVSQGVFYARDSSERASVRETREGSPHVL